MRKHPYRCMIHLLAFLLSLNTVAVADDDGKIPVMRIDATERPPLQTGLETGRQAKALFPDIERRYDAHLAALFSPAAFDETVHKHLPAILAQLEPEYQEELKGVAGAWSLARDSTPGDGQLSLDEYRILNLLPDLGFAPNGSGFGAFGKASAENGPIVGRNLDWNSSPELRSLQAITVYEYDDRSIVNIGFAGIVSVMSGFNSQGLFLSLFGAEPYSPYRSVNIPDKGLSSSVFELRRALERSSSVTRASADLQYKTYSFSNNILMADKRSVQVLEYPAGGIAQIRLWSSPLRTNRQWEKPQQIALVDCHLLATLPDNCKDANDVVRWQRLRQLAEFSAAQPANVNAISALLFDTANRNYEIFNDETLQSMVFLPASNSLYLYTAPVNGEAPPTPVHQPYLGLLPQDGENLNDGGKGISSIWLIWLAVLILLAITAWVSLRSRSSSTGFRDG